MLAGPITGKPRLAVAMEISGPGCEDQRQKQEEILNCYTTPDTDKYNYSTEGSISTTVPIYVDKHPLFAAWPSRLIDEKFVFW